MKSSVRARTLHKRGAKATENEDASSWHRYPREVRVAISDGASESSYAGQWARLLVADYVLGRLNPRSERAFQDRVLALGTRWDLAAPQPVAWYAAEKRARGAFATLAAANIRSDGTWSAIAVGDACVFHVREYKVIRSFPVKRSAQFSNSPALVSTARGIIRRHRIHGTWIPGDLFVLATDAVAAWILATCERGESLGELMACAGSQRQFGAWARLERAAGRLRNDDSTVVLVEPD